MGTKEHAKINYFAETMDEAAATLHKQQERIEALEEELARAGQTVIKPIPCRKFRDASTLAWIAKLTEETDEVVQEADILEEFADDEGTVDSDKAGVVDVNNRLAMELTDVITVCVSWLYAMGYDEVARGEVQRRVNEKNRKRGYHDEA